MRVVLQRVSRASVSVQGSLRAEIGLGLLVLLGIAHGDGEEDAVRLAGKVARLRVFEDDAGRFDRSLLDTGGAALVVSQFTLLADTTKGNRPSFTAAASPEFAEPVYASAWSCASSESWSSRASSAPGWRSSSSTTAR